MTDQALAGETGTSARAGRALAFVYGIASYALFFATFLYFIAFVGGIFAPKTVATGAAATPVAAWPLVVNLALIALFGIQHSVMARPAFKRIWTRLVPAPVERSTYVLAATAVLGLLMWLWQPMPGTVWHIDSAVPAAVLWTLFALGWAVVLASTFMTDHFDLFGLRQVYLYLRGRPYVPVELKARGLYRHMRHPLYAGFLLAFWAAPEMTAGRLELALGMSVYIVVGTLLEERDLLAAFGRRYEAYCRELPRFLPRLTPRA